MFIGPPNIEYPTYSPTIKHDYFTIQPNTDTFITFSLEHNTVLAKRGIFQPREYCSETLTLEDSVTCYKKCYLQKMNVKRLVRLEFRKSSNINHQSSAQRQVQKAFHSSAHHELGMSRNVASFLNLSLSRR